MSEFPSPKGQSSLSSFPTLDVGLRGKQFKGVTELLIKHFQIRKE